MRKTKLGGYHFRLTRDLTLFIIGCGIIIQQTLIATAQTERPYILALAAALVGVPLFQQLTEREERPK